MLRKIKAINLLIDTICSAVISLIVFFITPYEKFERLPRFVPDYLILLAVTTVLLVIAWLVTNKVLWMFVLFVAYTIPLIYLFKSIFFAQNWDAIPKLDYFLKETTNLVWDVAPFLTVVMFNAFLSHIMTYTLRLIDMPNEYLHRFTLYIIMLAIAFASVYAVEKMSRGSLTRERLYVSFVATVVAATIIANIIEYIAHAYAPDRDVKNYDPIMISIWLILCVFIGAFMTTTNLPSIRNINIAASIVFVLLCLAGLIPLFIKLITGSAPKF